MKIFISPTHDDSDISYEYTVDYVFDNCDVRITDRVGRMLPVDFNSVSSLILALQAVVDASNTVPLKDLELFRNDVGIYIDEPNKQ